MSGHDFDAVAEHLPGEPERAGAGPFALAVLVVVRAVALVPLAALVAPLWPLYLLSVAIWGWPPCVPRAAQVARYLRWAWTASPPAPGLRLGIRAWVTLGVLQKALSTPIWGLAWQLDELLYGRALRDTPLVAPLIEISAGRSGSTQLARYLEQDPHLAAPSLLQGAFPYLWLWRLAPVTLGRFVSREQVTHRMEAMLPPEFRQRHEGDPFLTDTFDAALYLAHLNSFAPTLGPDALLADFHFASRAPHAAELWERDFPDLLDRIGRKTLLWAGPGPDGGPRRFFVKGHFLRAADALERRYPDARFLTMIRDPAARVQSAVNYLRANPDDGVTGPTPWAWWARALVRSEREYGEDEQAWFTRQGGARRCVIRFSDYVGDLEGAMGRIYLECLDQPELPPHVPRTHPPRERTRYLLNRSLAQVGIDEAQLLAEAAPYVAWCRGEAPDQSLP